MEIKRSTMLLIFVFVCVAVFAVSFSEGKVLEIFPDTVISGSKISFSFDPNKATAIMIGGPNSAVTLMVRGDKTGYGSLDVNESGNLNYDAILSLFYSNGELNVIVATDSKTTSKVTFSKIDASVIKAKLNKVGSSEYLVGDSGPAGGKIIYDKGYYSDGWRYIEVAPARIRVIDNQPTIDTSNPWYDFADKNYPFGSISNGWGLQKEVGSGKKNTEILLSKLGDKVANYDVYGYVNGSTSFYAAKLCSQLVFNGFDDWYLPSIEELRLCPGGSYCWSSSIYYYKGAWEVVEGVAVTNSPGHEDTTTKRGVLPIRYF